MNNGVTNEGWFAVSRTVFDHYLVGIKSRPYTKFEAWLWMCGNANWRERYVMSRGQKLTLRRGDLLGSRSFLAKEWNWSPSKVRTFLDQLEAEEMITRNQNAPKSIQQSNQPNRQHNGNAANVLSVCNYGHFQDGSVSSVVENRQQPDQQNRQQIATKSPHHNKGTIKQEDSLPLKLSAKGPADDRVDEAIELYNEMAKLNGLPTTRGVASKSRQSNVRARIKDHGFGVWVEALGIVSQSPHLVGENDRGWRADIDWIAGAGNFQKIIEGRYRAQGADSDLAGPEFPENWHKAFAPSIIRQFPLDKFRRLDAERPPNGSLTPAYHGAPLGESDCIWSPEAISDLGYVDRPSYWGREERRQAFITKYGDTA